MTTLTMTMLLNICYFKTKHIHNYRLRHYVYKVLKNEMETKTIENN